MCEYACACVCTRVHMCVHACVCMCVYTIVTLSDISWLPLEVRRRQGRSAAGHAVDNGLVPELLAAVEAANVPAENSCPVF